MTALQKIGKYDIDRQLGSGAAGTAYAAIDTESGDQVAIKLLNAKTAGDPDIQSRFVREVSVLQKLEHPNIVQHYDCGIDESGRLFYAMELVDAGTLHQVLKSRRSLPWQDACEVGAQICDALAHAHGRGVIHRDLKPANLFLSSQGHVKVGDFGLARDMNQHRLTAEGNTVGTCRYMAPEQVRGADELDGTVDLYAVGCILFEMVAGRPPFDGNSVVEIFEHHLFTPPPRLDKCVGGCPQVVGEYVESLMLKKPGARPPKASDVAENLRALARGESVEIPGGEEGEAKNLVERISAPATSEQQIAWKPLAIAAAILIIAVVAVVMSQN